MVGAVVSVEQIAALGASLRMHLKTALKQGGHASSPLWKIIQDVQTRYAAFRPKYVKLVQQLRPIGAQYGLHLTGDDRLEHETVIAKLDDARKGYAGAFVDTLLHHYWHDHREALTVAIKDMDPQEPALHPFLAPRTASEPAALAHVHDTARRSLIPRRSYSARDWEIASHRIVAERAARTGRLSFSKLEIDSLPEAVLDMDWLTNLDCCSTLISHLPPLGRLSRLQTLDCSYTPLEELPSLHGCDDVIAVWCGVTNVYDLAPLADCTQLRVLFCGRTLIEDVEPLASCQRLENLHCEETKVARLDGLEACEALKTLDCQDTEVDDLSPLVRCTKLETLMLNGCSIADRSDAIWSLPRLRQVWLFRGDLAGVPQELLSRSFDDNCLQRIRSHIRANPS